MDKNKIVAWIVKGGLLAVPLLPLVVTRSLFFPFITGRNFIFRILVEVLFVLWLWLLLADPRYRLRASPIMWAVLAVVAILFLATILGIMPYKSFWSSFERMEGFWAHWHYLLYFLMLGSVFTGPEWRKFFLVSVAVSVMVSGYALLQLLGKLDVHQGDVRLDATMGNATYLAVYLVLHVFLILYFIFSEFREKRWWLRLPLGLAVVFELFIVYRTATRGAVLGFLAGLGVFLLVNLIWGQGWLRRLSLAALGLLAALPIVFVLIKDSSFIRGDEVLSRFANISVNETTTQSRFIIWNMAFEAWKERPVLGWGPESFVYIFSKYYDPRLWRQEPWFDRAHNVFLDWLTSAGLAGLVAYLSVFVFSAAVLYRLFKRQTINLAAFGAFAAILAAYFMNNIFVFDNFTSYMVFFALLAFWHTSYTATKQGAGGRSTRAPIGLRSFVVAVVAVVVMFSVYTFNVKPIWAAQSIIKSLSLVTYSRDGSRVHDLGEGVKALKKGIDYNTFGTTEIREQLAQYAERINRDPATSDEDKRKFLSFAAGQLKLQVRDFPYDVRAKAFLSTLNGEVGDYVGAVAMAQEGLAVSDKRQQFYFLLAEAYFKAGEENLAVAAVKRAYELAPEYPDAIHNYAVMLIFAGHPAEAEALLQRHFGVVVYPDLKYVNAYVAIGDFGRVAKVWEEVVAKDPNNIQYHLSLASAYVNVRQDELAIKELRKVVELAPNFRDQGEAFIRQIKEGKVNR